MIAKYFIPLSFLFISFSSCGQTAVQNNLQAQSPVSSTDTVPKKLRNYTRFEREILKFEESDRLAFPSEGSILFVGSSSIRLWKTLNDDMSPLPVVNRGFGGSTIAEVNYYYHRIVDKYKPKIVVFYAGENDLFNPEISVDSVIKDFNAFRDSMHTYLPNCQSYFLSIKPSPARWNYQHKFIEANNRFRAICDIDPRWVYIDITATMINERGVPRKEIYRSDSLHMNQYGYAGWKEIIAPKLKEFWNSKSKQK